MLNLRDSNDAIVARGQAANASSSRHDNVPSSREIWISVKDSAPAFGGRY
jgi:hypothetical protein